MMRIGRRARRKAGHIGGGDRCYMRRNTGWKSVGRVIDPSGGKGTGRAGAHHGATDMARPPEPQRLWIAL